MKRIIAFGLVACLTLGRVFADGNAIATPAEENPVVSKPGFTEAKNALALITTNNPAPDATMLPASDEVIKALKQFYVDRAALDPKKLNDASVAGILQMLGSGAKLLTAAEAASNVVEKIEPTSSQTEPLARVEVIVPEIGYIRLADVTEETAPALDAEFKKFAAEKVTGYVLDLRYADGTNYATAAVVASRFLPAGVEVFTLKQSDGTQHTYHTSEAPKTLAPELAEAPLMLLVNSHTRGSAEVLTGALRMQDRGIVVGSPTAGLPVAWEDTKLSDGRVLRLASAKISFPKGTEVFPGGIIPDIMVKIDALIEYNAVFNLQSNVTLTASLQPHVRKREYSEAALVKVFRGESIDTPALRLSQATGTSSNALTLTGEPPVSTNSTTNSVTTSTMLPDVEGDVRPARDVVLQRAVDILKGIRVLLSWQ